MTYAINKNQETCAWPDRCYQPVDIVIAHTVLLTKKLRKAKLGERIVGNKEVLMGYCLEHGALTKLR